jgi:hypothetical protein
MPEPNTESIIISGISAARTKLISALVIAFLLFGLAHEAISFLTGFYTLRKARCDSYVASVEALSKGPLYVLGMGQADKIKSDGSDTRLVLEFYKDCLKATY